MSYQESEAFVVAILVTGGAGYIGSHAAHALRPAGYEVIVCDNLSTGFRRLAKGFELLEGDIADKERPQPVLARVEAVLHFAATPMSESRSRRRANILEIMWSLL
jgi:UDP-glucose 4-epimerase